MLQKDENYRNGCPERKMDTHALDSLKNDEYRDKNQENSVGKSR
jgi:hypothetical protein